MMQPERPVDLAGAARCRSYVQSVCPRNLFVHLCPPRSCGTRETDPGFHICLRSHERTRTCYARVRTGINCISCKISNEEDWIFFILLIFMKLIQFFLLTKWLKLDLIERLIRKGVEIDMWYMFLLSMRFFQAYNLVKRLNGGFPRNMAEIIIQKVCTWP